MTEENGSEIQATPVARSPWRRSLFLGAVILLCGAVMGSVVTAVVLAHGPTHEKHRSDVLPEKIASEMRRKFDLTAEQEQRLKAIFEEHGKKLSEIRSEVQPRVEAEHESLRQAVESVLTPEQAKKWREKFEQMRGPWMRHKDRNSAP